MEWLFYLHIIKTNIHKWNRYATLRLILQIHTRNLQIPKYLYWVMYRQVMGWIKGYTSIDSHMSYDYSFWSPIFPKLCFQNTLVLWILMTRVLFRLFNIPQVPLRYTVGIAPMPWLAEVHINFYFPNYQKYL